MFINSDPAMVDAQGQHAKARNTNLNEDLGKVRPRAEAGLWQKLPTSILKRPSPLSPSSKRLCPCRAFDQFLEISVSISKP